MSAIGQLDAIDRHQCCALVEAHHSLESWGDRMEASLMNVITHHER